MGKKGICFWVFLGISTSIFAQIGINTPTPQVTLDVQGENPNGSLTAQDGVLVPRVNDLATGGLHDGQLIYLIADFNSFKKGFYFWSVDKWRPLSYQYGPNSASSLVEPDVYLFGGNPVQEDFTYNIPTIIPDLVAVDIPFNVAGFSGNTLSVSITINVSHLWDQDLDIFMRDPTGKWLELSTDNGGTDDDYMNTTFQDAAPLNITAGSAPFTGNYRPEGTLAYSGSPVNRTGTITSMAGFNGLNPNGQWILRIGDDENILEGLFNSATLSITGDPVPVAWILIAEESMDFFENSTIILQSSYSGDSQNNGGIVTAITRSTSSIPVGTSLASLPGAVLSYASASPGIGNDIWCHTSNLGRDVALVHNTTYFYQLWRQGNIDIPINANETFTLLPLRIKN